MTDQKLADIAAAVIAAMRASGTCRAASNCGITKKTIPSVEAHRGVEKPINQTGGTRRLGFTLGSRFCPSYYRARNRGGPSKSGRILFAALLLADKSPIQITQGSRRREQTPTEAHQMV